MRVALLVLVLVLTALAAGAAPMAEASFINGCLKLGITCRGISAAPAPPVTPCVGGQLDFSDVTGCNVTYYMTGTV